MSISITSIFLMSVLVLGLASYPSILPLGNVAFAQEEIQVELTEEVGISDEEEVGVDETEENGGEENGEEENGEDEDEIELKGKLTDNGDGTFDLDTGDGIETISTNADTEIDDGLSLSDLSGLEVEVEVVEINGVLFATEIEFEEDEVDAILATAEDEIELEGILTDNGDGTFDLLTADGIETISTNADTDIDDGLSLSDLNGKDVKVEVVSTDAGLLAIEIELEEYEENGEDGEKGPRGDKTEICHIPPGNPSKAHTITIGVPAVNKHLAHGDMMGTCDGIAFSTAKGEIYVGEQQSVSEARLAEKEARLADREARLADKFQALQRADELIQKLEQRIADLELRLQTLLNKVETGEYFGTVPEIDPVLHTYSISIDGTASSLFDESVTTDVSGEIFIENLVTASDVSKFKVTGGEIFVGDNIYDVVFGKARISSSGPSGEKDSMVLILQAIDSEGNGNTIRLSLDFESALEGDFGTEPIELEIIKNSKISGQWSLSASGQLSLLQA